MISSKLTWQALKCIDLTRQADMRFADIGLRLEASLWLLEKRFADGGWRRERKEDKKIRR